MADARPDLAVISIPVWAFPHFTMLAVRELTGPVLLISTVDPAQPGMVGMLAAAGSLDQKSCFQHTGPTISMPFPASSSRSCAPFVGTSTWTSTPLAISARQIVARLAHHRDKEADDGQSP